MDKIKIRWKEGTGLFVFLFLGLFAYQQLSLKNCNFNRNETCLADMAIKTNDISFCDKAKNDNKKNICLKIIERKKDKKETAETSDWKTYQNKKYGFEVKYPANMVAKDMPIAYMEGLGDISNADGIGPGVNIENDSILIFVTLVNSNECLEGTCLLRETSYKEYCDFYRVWSTKHGINYCRISPNLGTYLGAIEKRRAFDITENNNKRWYSVGFDISPDYIFVLNGKVIRASFSTNDLDKTFVDAVYEHYDRIKIKPDGKNVEINNTLAKSKDVLSEKEDILLKIISAFKFTE